MAAGEFTSYRTVVEDMALVTHAVPAERVRPHLPRELELDVIRGPEGEDTALVSATCFLNRDTHWVPLGETTLDFHQSTYRTYVKREGEAGAYLLGSYIERGTPGIFQRLGMRNAYAADFDVSLTHDPATRSYPRYYAEILSGNGDTIVEAQSGGGKPVTVMPFGTGEEMVNFITRRLIWYFPIVGGKLGSMRVEHAEMDPVDAELLAGQFDLWEELGILRPEEFEQPYSVLMQPSIEMTGYAPVPVG